MGGNRIKTDGLEGEKPTSASSKKTKEKPAAIVKSGRKTPSKKAPSTEAKSGAEKPPAAIKKAPATSSRRTQEKEGNTLIKNPIELSEKELKALETAALMGLDARQAKFCDLWLATYDQAQSYRDAGYRCKTLGAAQSGASRLLSKVKFHPYMKARQAELFKRTADIQNQIIGVVHAASFADPRELVEYVRRCCRYCYGKDHRYQFKPSEMEERRDEYDAALVQAQKDSEELEPFDEQGGLGYDRKKAPHPNCPECSGEGIGYAFFKDTSNLSPAALALYEGVKEGKDGTEIKVASQKGYRELLAKIFNLDVEPEVNVNIAVSDEVLNDVMARALAKTENERAEMLERERRLSEM